MERFADIVGDKKDPLAELIARETGKPVWEARTEAAGVAAKVAVSIAAYHRRTGTDHRDAPFGHMSLVHRPHGVMLVLGPFNFPAHLPNGHIVPALLAGNSVVFKPSELTPATGEFLANAWGEAGLPDGVMQLVQGGRDTGAALLETDIDGLLFTGSAKAGLHFQKHFADRLGFMLALELGGNNPLVYWDGEIAEAAAIICQSAFISAGQRCSCARRLIVPADASGDAVLGAVERLAADLRMGPWNAHPEPFMGPMISASAAGAAEAAVERLAARGAKTLLPPAPRSDPSAFFSPAILDVTHIERDDEEIFGPVLQVTRVADFDAALKEANATKYGLAATLISDEDARWESFAANVRAGVINRNRPTTGASSEFPFGGLGASGNLRPSGAYAADYCAYPVASAVSETASSAHEALTPYLETR